MEKDILNIAISGDEKNKNEIVYKNIIDAMNKQKMSKDEQIEYLKNKLTTLENEYQSNVIILITLAIAVIILAVGLYLLITDEYVLGIIFVLLAFFISIYKLITSSQKDKRFKNKKYMELETLRKNINSILK